MPTDRIILVAPTVAHLGGIVAHILAKLSHHSLQTSPHSLPPTRCLLAGKSLNCRSLTTNLARWTGPLMTI